MTSIDLSFPSAWDRLSQRQLLYIFSLLAGDFSADSVKFLALLRFNKIQVLGKNISDGWVLKFRRTVFSVSPLQLAEVLGIADWLDTVPDAPVILLRLHGRKAIAADFGNVPFRQWIYVDNLYQGYLATRRDDLMLEAAKILYPGIKASDSLTVVACFYWLAALKNFFARKFPEFYSASPDRKDSFSFARTSSPVEDAMNAQIRALTKGDVSKEDMILSIDTWRALTELDALAREYREINAKLK